MVTKQQDLIVYKDPFYYISFPSCVTLDSGDILISTRRALDPRYLLGNDAPEELKDRVTHVEARSHQAIITLGSNLQPVGAPRAIPMNPQAADQDGSLLKLSSGRILMCAFSWYPFTPPFSDYVRDFGRSFHGTPDTTGTSYLFWGGFIRYTDDEGTHWTDHNYLPPLPDSDDIIPNKRPNYGGGIRGAAAESDGEILVPTYTSRRTGKRSESFCYASQDNGDTWAFRSVVAQDLGNQVDMHEPAFYRTPSGRIICFIRTANFDDHLVTTESTDNGRTWSMWQRRDVIGHPYTPVRLPDDRVLLIYGYRHEPYGIRARLLDPECENLDTAEEIIIRDDGLGTDLGYPWGCALPNGKALALYYIYGEDKVRHIAGTVLEIK